MSLHRMRVIASMFPAGVGERLHLFARAAIDGGDKRWKALARGATVNTGARTKPLGELWLHEGPALTLKLRAGFGVNAKADVLAVLIGFAGGAADLKVIAAATAYTDRAVRTA
ncbi:MAG TPA: hypothetical protein VJ957_12290, partial [Longimicrobiales bacterium]|nr:hypothetical protein [Longimicrobiales bacterium]